MIPTILVFDSGIGGISVYNEVRQLLPDVHYIYAFDNQFFPYGDKDPDFLIDRVGQIINQVCKYHHVDLAIIACNTASTTCLPSLRACFSFPIVGVVPAIKPAAKLTKNKFIGLLATKATVRSQYTKDLVKKFASDCCVELLGLSELAIIAEQKLCGVPVNMVELQKLLTPWLILTVQPDVIVLGCTHYPFIYDELQELFPASLLIDSGHAIATRVRSLLTDKLIYSAEYVDEIKNNIVMSTLYNDQIEKVMQNLAKFNFNKYQLIAF